MLAVRSHAGHAAHVSPQVKKPEAAAFGGKGNVVLRLWSKQGGESLASEATDYESDKAQYGSEVSVREADNWNTIG